MTLWHLVQTDSRCNRQTDRQIEIDCWTDKQTDRAGSWSAFSSMTSGVGGVTGDFATPPPPWKVQWILADRGEEDTSCQPAGFSTLLCAFSPTCDLEAFQGGARRSLVPVLSSLHQSVERKSSRSQEEDDRSGDSGEENMDVVLKKWISCPHFSISILIGFGCSFIWLLMWLSPGHTLTEEGGRVSWLNCFSAFSRSSRKNSAVARKNMPPRTMMKGQSMRA